MRRTLLALLLALAVLAGSTPQSSSAQNWTNPTCTDGARTGGWTTYCAGAEYYVANRPIDGRLTYSNATPWFRGQSECSYNTVSSPYYMNGCTWGVYNFSEWYSPDNGANWQHQYAWGTDDNVWGNGGGPNSCCSSWMSFTTDGYNYDVSQGGIIGYTTSQELHDYIFGQIWDSCGTILWIETWNNNVFDSGAQGC